MSVRLVDTVSYQNRFLSVFEVNAMSELQRDVLQLMCDKCNWTANFVHASEQAPDGWVFKTISRANGHVFSVVYIENKQTDRDMSRSHS